MNIQCYNLVHRTDAATLNGYWCDMMVRIFDIHSFLHYIMVEAFLQILFMRENEFWKVKSKILYRET